jgi:hypothetical protein
MRLTMKEKLTRIDGKLVKLKAGVPRKRKKREGKRVYGEEVIASLRLVWAFFWYRCGKLLSPLMRSQMRFIAAWKPFGITPDIREKLMTISPRTRFRGGDYRPEAQRRPEKAGR